MLCAPDKPAFQYPHVYATVRFDTYQIGEHSATVVKVISSEALAEKEAARPNEVNKGKQCLYRVQTTRFVEATETS